MHAKFDCRVCSCHWPECSMAAWQHQKGTRSLASWPALVVVLSAYLFGSTPASARVLEHGPSKLSKRGDPLPETISEVVAPYPLEHHRVTTEDGYILALYRIPGTPEFQQLGQASSNAGGNSSKPAVLLLHGLLDSCAGFLLQGPDSALAFKLADAGFDVWLANSRGSTQSKHHAWLPVTSAKFWAFSFDEMAKYDLPACVDYVRKYTGQPRINFVSHSQGGTIMLAALSSQPQLADKLKLMVLMAPVATARHATSVPLQAMAAIGTEGVFTLLGIHEFMPSIQLVSWLEGQLCEVQPDLCISILAAICGYRRNAVNMTRLPLYLKFTPAGTSVQNMAHWAQNMRGSPLPGRPQLSYFDYGTSCGPQGRQQTCNQERYGSIVPPVYQLSNIPQHARMVIFTGGADRIADPLDVELLLEQLPARVVVNHHHDADLEHLDYIWGEDAATRVYKPVVDYLLQDVKGVFDDRKHIPLEIKG